jgi:hypothetical protein
MGLLGVLLKQRLRCVETVSRDLSSKQSSMTKDRGKQVQHNDTVVSVGRQGVPCFLLDSKLTPCYECRYGYTRYSILGPT